jgi:hypothetical protein
MGAYKALDACFVAHAYQLRQADTGAYNCRVITGGTGYSLHAYGPGDKFVFTGGVRVTSALACDVNWLTNPYGPVLVTDMPKAMIRDVKAVRTRSGMQVWRWGGDYTGNRDAMHFEVVAHPNDLATGIDPATVPGYRPVPPPPVPTLSEEESMFIMKGTGYVTRFVDPPFVVPITPDEEAAYQKAGVKVLPTSKPTAVKIVQQSGQALD